MARHPRGTGATQRGQSLPRGGGTRPARPAQPSGGRAARTRTGRYGRQTGRPTRTAALTPARHGAARWEPPPSCASWNRRGAHRDEPTASGTGGVGGGVAAAKPPAHGPPPSAGRASRRGAGSERAVADGHRPRCSPLTGAGGGTTRHHAGKALRPERSPQRTGDAFLHTKSRPDSGTDNKRNAVEPQGSTLPARCFQRSSTLTIVMEANRRRPVFVAGHRERQVGGMLATGRHASLPAPCALGTGPVHASVAARLLAQQPRSCRQNRVAPRRRPGRVCG